MSNTITIRITGLLEGTQLSEMAAEHPTILEMSLVDLRAFVMESLSPSAIPDSGHCSVCRRVYAVTKLGLIWTHSERRTDPACRGSKRPPGGACDSAECTACAVSERPGGGP